MGVSCCWGALAASEEQNVVSGFVFLKRVVGMGLWDLELGNLTSGNLGWREVGLEDGEEMGESSVLEKAEGANAIAENLMLWNL